MSKKKSARSKKQSSKPKKEVAELTGEVIVEEKKDAFPTMVLNTVSIDSDKAKELELEKYPGADRELQQMVLEEIKTPYYVSTFTPHFVHFIDLMLQTLRPKTVVQVQGFGKGSVDLLASAKKQYSFQHLADGLSPIGVKDKVDFFGSADMIHRRLCMQDQKVDLLILGGYGRIAQHALEVLTSRFQEDATIICVNSSREDARGILQHYMEAPQWNVVEFPMKVYRDKPGLQNVAIIKCPLVGARLWAARTRILRKD